MASRIETTRDQIVTALRLITTANGYNNTIANVSKAIILPEAITSFPHLCLELGTSVIEMKNDARTVFDEIADCHIVGYVISNTETATDPDAVNDLMDAMETLLHDLKKKICTDLLLVNIADGSNRWNVELSDNKLVFERANFLGMGRNLGIVSTSFKIRVRSLSGTFA